MFNSKSIDKIVKDSIELIQSAKTKSRSDEHLVLLTFLMESNMESVFQDDIPVRHGLMSMTFQDFKEFVNTKLKINKLIIEDIRNICLVDVENDTVEDMFEALMYNLSFQVLIVWAFYRIHMTELPQSVEGVVSAYLSVWDYQDTDRDYATNTLIAWLRGDY